MGLHQRQIIREAVKTALLNATAAADRVFETRIVPWRRLELPALAIYTLQEGAEDRSTAPRELTRTMQLAIEAAVKQSSNVDDAMDAISLEIEKVMHADETFGGVAGDSVLTSTELDVMEEADRPVGLVRLVYTVTYYTHAPEADDVALDDLETVHVTQQIGGPGGNSSLDILDGLSKVTTQVVLTAADPIESTFPILVGLSSTVPATGVDVVRVENLTTPGAALYEPVWIDWAPSGNDVSIKFVSGLTPGQQYRLTLEVLR